ncbi:MAG: SAM-dependent methyltransferase [Tatlockia sp.]|nr:SAM-dependent methyltransferase [Tatlockia sp.]
MNLLELICSRIENQGELPFVDFMQQALYDPKFGYYSGGLQKFGAQGDFITAPELTPLYAETLANQCQQVLSSLIEPCLFEFGAGSGRLCVDLLKALEKRSCLPEKYYILEISPNLRQRQQELFAQAIPHLVSKINWLERWPEKAFSGVIIANEVLDAMPVHRFLQTEEGIEESFVSFDEKKGNLVEHFKPSTNQRLINYLQENVDKELFPYLSEVNLFVEDWIKHCFTMLTSGAMFIIDYGFPRHEYYHSDRNMGTLMCHYRHHAHPDPLIHVGEQDITAHVDFTQVAEAAFTAGFHVAGYTNQASFLLANGLLSLLQLADYKDKRQEMLEKQAVKQLIQPNEMGELFKVIALTKNLDLELTGFQLQDKRASL